MLPLAIMAAGMLSGGGSDDEGGGLSNIVGSLTGGGTPNPGGLSGGFNVGTLLNGVLSNVTDNTDRQPFRTLGDVSAPWNVAYIHWVDEFYPEKGKGTSSIWDDPGGVQTFRSVVSSWKDPKGWSWEQVDGHIDRNMQYRAGAAPGMGGNVTGQGVVTDAKGIWANLTPWGKVAVVAGGGLLLYGMWMLVKRLTRRRYGR